MVINMGRFEKRFSRFFPHLQIVLSLSLIIQWILLLFNPNLGLLNLNDPLSALYLLFSFVLLFAGGLYSWLCRKNTPFLPAGTVFFPSASPSVDSHQNRLFRTFVGFGPALLYRADLLFFADPP